MGMPSSGMAWNVPLNINPAAYIDKCVKNPAIMPAIAPCVLSRGQ